jgi:hypothetical protein
VKSIVVVLPTGKSVKKKPFPVLPVIRRVPSKSGVGVLSFPIVQVMVPVSPPVPEGGKLVRLKALVTELGVNVAKGGEPTGVNTRGGTGNVTL